MSTKKAIAMLWDQLTLVGLLLAGALWASRASRYLQPELLWPAALLFVPALLGNLASIPLFWRCGSRRRAPKLLVPSAIVGVVGWLLFVPLASWISAPLLSLRPAFEPLRELPLLALYFALGELWFYGVHRVLHSHKMLFRLFHAHHHRITDPHVANASYQHPVELLLITMGTAWVGPMLVSGHWITVSFFMSTVMVLGNYGHCGEESIHDSHHRGAPRSHFGFLFMDAVVAAAGRWLQAAAGPGFPDFGVRLGAHVSASPARSKADAPASDL